ncbi:BPI fold-containing family A member 2-like [Myotis myotis]|uniref:BPI fold-containing family A member 2-like n=1 Tax=Myotis myotis TaxID=51298 RepID=UPI001749121E|nr:BPI fold-containing family A member 2-like [Myotis myotis]
MEEETLEDTNSGMRYLKKKEPEKESQFEERINHSSQGKSISNEKRSAMNGYVLCNPYAVASGQDGSSLECGCGENGEESKVWLLAKQKVQEVEKLVNNALSNILSLKDKALKLKIGNSHILDVKAKLTSDGKGLNLKLPVTTNVTLILPLIGKVVNLKTSLDLLTCVKMETNVQADIPTVVQGECTCKPSQHVAHLVGQPQCTDQQPHRHFDQLPEQDCVLPGVEADMPSICIFISTLAVNFIQNTPINFSKESSTHFLNKTFLDK